MTVGDKDELTGRKQWFEQNAQFYFFTDSIQKGHGNAFIIKKQQYFYQNIDQLQRAYCDWTIKW